MIEHEGELKPLVQPLVAPLQKGPEDFKDAFEEQNEINRDPDHTRRVLFHPGNEQKPNVYVPRDPTSDDPKEKRKITYIERLEKLGIIYDKDHGPLVYQPYAGGSKFPKIDPAYTTKPGFKIWVDGGVIDYDTNPVYRATCAAKQLDCFATCCMQSYCAPHAGLCLRYGRRPYNELYIGVLVMLAIVAGFPTCISTCEFILTYKFCQTYDEENDITIGGMTVLECVSWIFTCGKAMKLPEAVEDEYIVDFNRRMAKIEEEEAAARAEEERLAAIN